MFLDPHVAHCEDAFGKPNLALVTSLASTMLTLQIFSYLKRIQKKLEIGMWKYKT